MQRRISLSSPNSSPCALMLRGGVHQAAYAMALRKITGVEVTRILPTPNIDDAKIPETREWQAIGSHRRLYTFSDTGDYAMSLGSDPATRTGQTTGR